jgi:hypothetical protein
VKKVVAALALLAFSSTVLATMPLQKELVAKYPGSKANCTTCHNNKMVKKGEPDLNPYGKDMVAKAVIDAKAEKKAYDYAKIDALDSDKDGKTNAEELKAGTNPGDPNSK